MSCSTVSQGFDVCAFARSGLPSIWAETLLNGLSSQGYPGYACPISLACVQEKVRMPSRPSYFDSHVTDPDKRGRTDHCRITLFGDLRFAALGVMIQRCLATCEVP